MITCLNDCVGSIGWFVFKKFDQLFVIGYVSIVVVADDLFFYSLCKYETLWENNYPKKKKEKFESYLKNFVSIEGDQVGFGVEFKA